MEIYTQEYSGGECFQKEPLWGRGRKQPWVQREVELLCALTGGLADLTRRSGVGIVLHIFPQLRQEGLSFIALNWQSLDRRCFLGRGHDLGGGSCFQQQAILQRDIDEHCELTNPRQLQSWRETGGRIAASPVVYQKCACFLPGIHALCLGTWDLRRLTRSSFQSK